MGGAPVRSIARFVLLVVVAVSLLGACSSSEPSAVDAGGAPTTADGSTSTSPPPGSTPTSDDPAAADADGSFCVALDRYLELSAEASAMPDSVMGELTAEQAELLRTTVLPAPVGRLQLSGDGRRPPGGGKRRLVGARRAAAVVW